MKGNAGLRSNSWFRGSVLGLLLAAPACKVSESPADLILTGANLYTLNWEDPDSMGRPSAGAPFRDGRWQGDAEAVAIRAGRIQAVGAASEMARYRGSDTRVRDLAGATVIPGLIDSHTHVEGLGARLSQVDLRGADTEDEVIRRLQEAAGRSAGGWIVGSGWDEGAWANRYPDSDRLSRAFPDHSVVVRGLHGFAIWANRRALEAAGIDPGTQSPPGGEILRDERGRLTGVLLNRAVQLLSSALPRPSPEERMERFRLGLEEMARSGYTGVHEAGLDGSALRALVSLASAGELPIYVYAMLSSRDEPLLRQWIARGPQQESKHRLTVRAVKAYYDGALGSRGARLLDDYADRPGHRGVSGDQYGFDRQLVVEAMAAGFQVGIHAIGDAGNREVLDFYQEVFAALPGTVANRHRIEHAQVLHPEDFARVGKLELIASMQPPHAVEDKAWAELRLGPARTRGAYAWRTLRRNGVLLILNSDLSGSDHDIFYGLHAAITRRDRQLRPEGGWYPEERLSPEEALRGYTSWPAHAAFQDDVSGRIAPGYRADLTVLSVDPLDAGSRQPEALLQGRVLMTIVEGVIAFDAE